MKTGEADFSWATKGAPAKLLELLNRKGEARFVGGCVRDSLIGLPPGQPGRTDIDIATTLLPEETMKVLEADGIRGLPTGVEHGTVTAVIDHVPYEITTLRADVETDGRRAVVAFTADWAKDAARRDFTINALYLTAEGQVIDLTGGRDDLSKGRVRFIGSAEERIREDYLRILRFLRFSARFSDKLEPDDWAACVRLRSGIEQLSKERIWSEVSRLFIAEKAPMVIAAAAREGVLQTVLAGTVSVDSFVRLHARREGNVGPALGLAALWPEADRPALKAAFKPSLAALDEIQALRAAAAQIAGRTEPRLCLYNFGRDICLKALDLAAARDEGLPADRYAEMFEAASVPVLPLKGADFIARGIPSGPEVGEALKRFEGAWIEAGFPTDEAEIIRLADVALKPV